MRQRTKIAIKGYEKSAAQYAEKVERLHPRKEAKKFLSLLPPRSSILDLCCGSGRDARIFAEKGFSVTGIDLSENLLKIAQMASPKAVFEVMDMYALQFRPETFDAIWANAALVHVPKGDAAGILKKCWKILKPNGLLFLSLKKGEGEGISSDKRYGGVRKFWAYYAPHEIIDIACEAGFELIEKRIAFRKNAYSANPWIRLLLRKK